MLRLRHRSLGDPSVLPTVAATAPTVGSDVASGMVLRGAAGTLVGAAVAPKGQEGVWGAIGFGLGALLGEYGILAVAAVALWRKTEGRNGT